MPRPTKTLLSALALLAAIAGPKPVEAQVPACTFRGAPDALATRESPLDSVMIRLGDATAKLCYGRPSARGRVMVGGEDPFGLPWRMGANEPTTLHLTGPARLGDISLERGSYVLYAVPGQEEWKIVVNGAVDRWGVPIDEDVRQHDIGSVTVTPGSTSGAVEALDLRLEPGDGDGVDLVVEWERTRLSVPIRPAEAEGY